MTQPARPLCPVCGAMMLRRSARRGRYRGRDFFGCSRYPACSGIVNIPVGQGGNSGSRFNRPSNSQTNRQTIQQKTHSNARRWAPWAAALVVFVGIVVAITFWPDPEPTALCRDGTYSFSEHRQGTCSWHGGVRQWLKSVPARK